MLNDAQVKALKPTDNRYSVADGEGLNILVMPHGKKKWMLSYRINGKQSQKLLGEYPDVGCKEARQLARKFKADATGKSNAPTVDQVVKEWLALMLPQWTDDKYISTVLYRLDYITADFKNNPIDEITRKQVSAKVKEIVAKGTLETANRCLALLNRVFNFAISSDYTEKNPCILVGDIIPDHEVNHYPCLPVTEMPEFFRRLKQCGSTDLTKTALTLACYTGVRISELLKARWDKDCPSLSRY